MFGSVNKILDGSATVLEKYLKCHTKEDLATSNARNVRFNV